GGLFRPLLPPTHERAPARRMGRARPAAGRRAGRHLRQPPLLVGRGRHRACRQGAVSRPRHLRPLRCRHAREVPRL
ncbi:MAG: FIG00802536: hypothetical protein, partial [uncultured Microvirga sp.]